MKIYLKEKIGNPELFTGRKREMAYLLNWVSRIKGEHSRSTAILSRRKTGKSAMLQRLYNLTFHNNNGVIPFYFEIQETDQWLGDFSIDFFLTFVHQYIAFKTRNVSYMPDFSTGLLDDALDLAQREKFDFVAMLVKKVKHYKENRTADALWRVVQDIPRHVATYNDELIAQMIDEFQFINRFIFWDKEKTRQADNLAGSYLHTAEYLNAPLLVSGSWIGWLMNDLISMLPGRFQTHHLEDIPEDEAIEMIYRYSLLEDIPVTQESAYLMAGLTEGNPFYISGLFRSAYIDKDLTTEAGLLATLEFETLHRNGNIRGTWLEYIASAFPRINERSAKDIVLYLSKHRDRLITRQTLKRELNLEMSDDELHKKLKALLLSDIIEENYFKYQGVQDNIFGKIFRSEYGHDIETFVPQGMRDEYKALFDELKVKYDSLSGEHNRYKGAFAEFMIIHHLRFKAYQENELYYSMLQNLPADFEFVEYETVWGYHSPPLHEPAFQVDLFAKVRPDQISLIGEVKHRQTTKFSIKEAQEFQEKAVELIRLEQVENYLLFVFSSAGFVGKVFDYFKDNHIIWSDDPRWLDRG